MNSKLTAFLILTMIVVAIASCNTTGGKRISEGTIIYKMNYPKDKNESSLVYVLPETITMRFKNSNTSMSIKGFAGSFELNYITNIQEKRNYSLMRILIQKYIYVSDTNEISFGYERMENLKIETFESDTMTIAGYLCHRATATNKDGLQYQLWYTHNIIIDNPNVNNPFRDLNGVLMKFEVVMAGIYMEVEAIKVDDNEISYDTFKIPDGYKIVTKKELEEQINLYNKRK